MNRAKLYAHRAEVHARCFEHHILKDQGHGRYYICQPGTSNYWVEILVVRRGLIVHGDVPTAHFQYCDEKDPRKVVAWIASGHISYVAEKFRIGMNDNGLLCYDRDRDLAHQEFAQLIKDNDCVPEKDFDTARHYLEDGDYDGCDRALYDLDIEHPVGKIISSRVVVCHAAVQALWRLLG